MEAPSTDVKLNVNNAESWRGSLRMVSIGDIIVGTRARRDFGNITELADSIRTYGLDNPLTVTPRPDGKYELVAGERRYRALVMLTCLTVPVLVREDWDAKTRKLFELEENSQRKEMTWQERIEHCRQLDDLERELHEGRWDYKDTGARMGLSSTVVCRDIALANKLKARPELRKLVQDLPKAAAARKIEQLERAERAARSDVRPCAALRRGHAKKLLDEVPSGSVGLVLTDPPYGLGTLAEAGDIGTTLLREGDNRDEAWVMYMVTWLFPQIRRVLVEGGHFYVFFAQEHYEVLRTAAKASGLEIQEYPLMWLKPHPTAPGRGYLYMPCYEPILFGWKPPRRRMLEKNAPAVMEFPPVSTQARIHPFEKPSALVRFLIQQSTLRGETVLDPFCGSGVVVEQAILLGRSGLGFDLDPSGETFALATQRVERAVGRSGKERS